MVAGRPARLATGQRHAPCSTRGTHVLPLALQPDVLLNYTVCNTLLSKQVLC